MRTPPYLPFLEGPARVAPQLKPISPILWLRPDTELVDWIDAKTALIDTRRDDVFAIMPDAEEAADEAGSLIRNALRPIYLADLISRLPVFEHSARKVSDDLCVMIPRDGLFHLGAACLCAPSFWRLKDKIGKPLGGLHEDVPGGNPQLSTRISRVFSGLKPDTILERFNWTVQLDGERFTPSSAPMKAEIAGLCNEEVASRLFLRVERQTVRKLEYSGAILFTIRVCVDPLPPILADPDNRTAFRNSWVDTDQALRRYKGWPAYERAIAHLLSAD